MRMNVGSGAFGAGCAAGPGIGAPVKASVERRAPGTLWPTWAASGGGAMGGAGIAASPLGSPGNGASFEGAITSGTFGGDAAGGNALLARPLAFTASTTDSGIFAP